MKKNTALITLLALFISSILISCDRNIETGGDVPELPEPAGSYSFGVPDYAEPGSFHELDRIERVELFNEEQVHVREIIYVSDNLKDANEAIENYLASESVVPDYFRAQFASLYMTTTILDDKYANEKPASSLAYYATMLAENYSPEVSVILNAVERLEEHNMHAEAAQIAKIAVKNNLNRMSELVDCPDCSVNELLRRASEESAEFERQKVLASLNAMIELEKRM